MKIDNFNLIEVIGSSAISWKFRATVDVITKKWFKEKIEQREVFCVYGGNWYFVDNGEWTPGQSVHYLARSLEARKGKDLHLCLVING